VTLNGIVIDITADQFDDAPSPVIVEAKSKWHAQLKGGERSDFLPITEYDQALGPGEQKPSEVYEIIVRQVRVQMKSRG